MKFKYVTLFIILFFLANVIGSEKLYIFYPSPVRPHILQKNLSETCPDIEVTVFGRYKDFIEKIKITAPDAIITKPDLLPQLPDYKKKATGLKDGKSSEAYFLLSVDSKIDVSKIGQETIGVVDFLGRQGMENLISTLFTDIPKVKRVTKVEDLLPLLTFNMATALFLSEKDVEYLKKKSKLNLKTTPLPNAEVGIVSFAIKKDKGSASMEKAFHNIEQELQVMLKLDNWD